MGVGHTSVGVAVGVGVALGVGIVLGAAATWAAAVPEHPVRRTAVSAAIISVLFIASPSYVSSLLREENHASI
jgi:O-antigen/teichoic acid export membrane protein